ncbi:MAG TPA: alkaline phosphatase family protein [Burkholderiales bacterium]|nr:alkaline phosphatase family protein [Burkholderiales bacterium]
MKLIALLLLAALQLLLAGCTTLSSHEADKPRLVAFLVVDGLPQRQVLDYRDQLAPDGLRRFLDRGTWFADAHYGQAVTQTAPGHAVMLTGAYPHRTGIIANEWRDPATGETEYNTADPTATYIGHKTNRLDGTSPKNLRAETVGDVLRRLDPRSKVIAISGKDRGAILPAGRAGVAYMYQAETGEFASSTYYMQAHPRWVTDFHAGKPADRYFHKEWRPLLEPSAYSRSLPDAQKWYAKWGGKLPLKLGEGLDAPGPMFYSALLRSPFGDEFTLAFARAAIAGEDLGKDDAPDIIVVSLSTHDYLNHGFGSESRISHDHLLQLDRLLEGFLRDLDATVGKDRYLAVLTADHGFMPAPEYSQARGQESGRLSGSQLIARLNADLSERFGKGQWALGMSAQAVVFNHALIKERGIDLAALQEETRRLLLAEKAVAAAYTRAEIESGSRAGAPFFEQIRKSWDRERSADIAVALKPYWMYSSSTSMTTHGSPHPYDTQVPILFYGPRWVRPSRVDGRVEVADIAPTLARILGIPAPSSSEGKPLCLTC